MALDATLTLAGPNGRRQVSADDFFVDYLQSVLEPDEVLVEVSMPKLGGDWGVAYGTLPAGTDTEAILDRARVQG